MDWSEGNKEAEYVHTELSQEFMEELKEKDTVDLLKLKYGQAKKNSKAKFRN